MKERNFFAELKRRNVYKVAVAYIVAGWALAQGIAQVFPVFDIPNWAIRLIVSLMIIGFPVAVVFAWLFEITPEGIKRTQVADAANQRSRGRTWIYVVIVGAIVSLGLFFLGRYTANKNSGAARTETTAGVPEKSIAVLPFSNLSDDKANAYFTEGIQDEILTRLSKIAALKVISRTSTRKYQSVPDDLREVGRQLGVAHVLEGSVQKIANAVHVNVQLIRAATDEHLWAESYNRHLDDVFGVEAEVAGAIAEQLNAKLSGAEQKAISDKPTENVAAYDAYLRGLAIERDRYSFGAYQEAAAAYAEAVKLDPRFAVAWARLGAIRSFLFFNGVDPKTNSAAAVKEAADQAMSLKPDLGEAWIAQGAYRYRVLRDFSAALQAYDEARKRLPNSSLVYQYMAYVERRLGLWKEAEAHFQKAVELDPRDLQLLVTMGAEFLRFLRRFDEAQAFLDQALTISPNDESALANKASVYQSQGFWAEAARQLARIPPNSSDDLVVLVRASQAMHERQFDAAIALIEPRTKPTKAGEPLNATAKEDLTFLGYLQEWAGRPEEARATFTRAVQAIKPSPDFVVSPDSQGLPYSLALAYAGLGEKEKALEQANHAVFDYRNDAVNKPNAETVLAQIQARFGDTESAIAAIPHLLQVPAGITPADLRDNPAWDPLRKDPRFQKLCQEKSQ
jgi:TolB-like protein/Tfp pilus assembly protein PilF